MKSTFLEEIETKKALSSFILSVERFSMGEQCQKFEKEFSEFQGMNQAVLFNSGGSSNLAILQTLKNLGKLEADDKIAFSALTWSTNVMPIMQLGMEPVPVDCEPTTLNSMSYQLKKRLDESDIKAFFITNALGFAGDLNAIRQICDERSIILLEDNCEALGTELVDGKTGAFGDMASFSFYVAHHLSTIEGGMVCTNNDEYAEMLRIVRANGWDRNISEKGQEKWRSKYNVNSTFNANFTFYDLGYNLRPTEITGFLGRSQMKFLHENIATREKNYRLLEKEVKKNPDLLSFDHSHITKLSSFAFPVMCKTPEIRERYLAKFIEAGVEVRPMIAGNMQNQPFYKKYISQRYNLEGTDKIHNNGFYFGNYPELSDADLQTIGKCLKKF
jgi:CDP-4-dehydro-6-deoxyglucose reductase, E1